MSMPWNHSKSSCPQISTPNVVLQRRMNQTKLKQVRTKAMMQATPALFHCFVFLQPCLHVSRAREQGSRPQITCEC